MASSATILNPETSGPKPENARANSEVPLNDGLIRLIMIPLFGIAIPNLTGYFGPYGPGTITYWVGLAWGMLISYAIWEGNRYLLIKQRRNYDWFRHPIRKVTILAFACVFYTAPCSVSMVLAWYALAGFGPDWNVIRIIALACVICVAFITHVYETVYLIEQRESDMLAVERLQRARTESELEALKTQVAPHFLFNSLNTLSWLIERDSPKAAAFTQNLAEIYRYILQVRNRDLVSLEEEWTFLEQYCALLKLRFDEGLHLRFESPGDRLTRWYVPPVSLQLLVENAVKHNEHSSQNPLRLSIQLGTDDISVINEKRARISVASSSGTGLSSLDERCRLSVGRAIAVVDTPDTFTVRVPVRFT